MSASQAMSAARRRRGAGPTPPDLTNTKKTVVGGRRLAQPHAKIAVPEVTPEVKPREPVSPAQLLIQHDKRLFMIESTVPEALVTIHSNLDVLTTSFNELSEIVGGDETLESSVTVPGTVPATMFDVQSAAKIDTALSEAMIAKGLSQQSANAVESLKINEFRELRDASDEMKAEIAELRRTIDVLRTARAEPLPENEGVGEVELTVMEN